MTDKTATILVADDDRAIADAIEIYLRGEGYEVLKAYDGLEALAAARTQEVQLIIMDVMMPGMDGLRATMKIREEKDIPILMLSAKSEDIDKITGLGIGADDYVTKPFSPLELTARVKAILRRCRAASEGTRKSGLHRSGGLVIDDEAKSVTVDGEMAALTPTELGILTFLTANAGHVFSIEQIYEAVWNEQAYNPENTVAVHIRRIREKIEIDPKNPRYLKVVWGIGYKVEKYA
ncbi:MAG: response regulator transcription factor [Clostridiales Family XIII bacterium]|jgi:DNA-binding response OmpR family regulator|nr:response regulator transcription factor [Clostridiales Family XIII bacterium]